MIKTVLKLGVPTFETGRIYTQEVVEAALIKTPLKWVVLDSPDDGQVHMDRVVGSIVRTFIEDDELKAEIKVLETPMGLVYKSLDAAKVRLGFHTASVGKVDENSVVSDLAFICVFVSSRPSP